MNLPADSVSRNFYKSPVDTHWTLIHTESRAVLLLSKAKKEKEIKKEIDPMLYCTQSNKSERKKEEEEEEEEEEEQEVNNKYTLPRDPCSFPS
ncbi:uncharacterized protein N7515_007524 [Penicillium bovifimosum]|uniref:Uncharacterized protein n=1 Tax=Penicillium bovifimosum TaxID=126998 RepID=A0A9W9GWU0_9EURO|nr:uncharacterized protein N7515_007524 [Penicillium bovifimosum]KAJ5131485.1 hypothetical protein N7515_007524 [Penicillium bovifimosum]